MPAHPLDNPIWNALSTRQGYFAQGGSLAKRYPADVAPFIAASETGMVGNPALASLATAGEVLYLIGSETIAASDWEVEQQASVVQMIHERHVLPAGTGMDAMVLGHDDVQDMLELTSVAFPGFFKSRTIEMGTYLGIRWEGRLIAMAGERMFVGDYREISGICTHPEYRGRGYAQQLIARLVENILQQGLKPFLHVGGANAVAEKVYQKMGFVRHNELPLLRVRKITGA